MLEVLEVTKAKSKLNPLECEFPPKIEEDLTHIRRKRLTAEDGLVCLEDYPYSVSIRLHERHWCGGAIVGRQYVLSAAQNFDYISKDEVTVRLGSVYRDFGGKLLSVIEIIRHPKYAISRYYPDHNLAILKLNIPISLSARVQVVALPNSTPRVPNFGEVVVTGFGAVKSGRIREGKNQELRRMIVKEVSKADCRLMYGNDYQIQNDHVCLKSVVKHVALCAGDIGDPAVHFTGENRAGTLLGVAVFSGAEECAYKERPGIYAFVDTQWIKNVMLENNKDTFNSTETIEDE